MIQLPRIIAAVLALLLCGVPGHAQETAELRWDDPELALHVPQEILQKFRNPDGSCVQCSNSMTGTDQNIGSFAYLLFKSDFGPSVRGGSNPSRVAAYAKERGVKIYNVTGEPTWEWMKWACANGRGCAIGAGESHFQTLVGYNPTKKCYYVVNNNGDQRIQRYDEQAFRRLHLASGPWCVILDYPPAPAPPEIVEWWNDAPCWPPRPAIQPPYQPAQRPRPAQPVVVRPPVVIQPMPLTPLPFTPPPFVQVPLRESEDENSKAKPIAN